MNNKRLLKQHIDELQRQIYWLGSLAYKYHFDAITTEFWGKFAYKYQALDEHIADEWEVDRMKFDDIRRELKHYKNMLAIYTAEQNQGGEQ